MGVEEMGESRKTARKVCKMGIRSGRTPGYIIREEEKREKMRTRIGRRAMRDMRRN